MATTLISVHRKVPALITKKMEYHYDVTIRNLDGYHVVYPARSREDATAFVELVERAITDHTHDEVQHGVRDDL